MRVLLAVCTATTGGARTTSTSAPTRPTTRTITRFRITRSVTRCLVDPAPPALSTRQNRQRAATGPMTHGSVNSTTRTTATRSSVAGKRAKGRGGRTS
ncbi:hypothetical protein EJ04DRAFT_344371 [Polyplosphaeria fusca]|uniref:Uncharacterized protein n=1 Tax=Polyplosphaeria fusca TaxID=682080 RepID=A0A9P4QTE5_9PLEO|nr:hypothetical protein EJ04DRAFT_344371 [Polyplosphaeria fusca]